MGIDPGVNGGLAVLDRESRHHVFGFKPTMTQKAVVETLRNMLSWLHPLEIYPRVYIEKVGYMPKDGRKGANTFGRVDGVLRGAVLMWIEENGGELREVSPMAWQGRLKCLTGGNKNVSKRKAQELFPWIKVTHSIADALLIARFGQLDEAP
jgi:hypothetical protein